MSSSLRAPTPASDGCRGGFTGGIGLLNGSYDYRLVIASSLLATFAGDAVLDLAARLSIVRGRSRFLWLIIGSIAMGLAIVGAHLFGDARFQPAWTDSLSPFRPRNFAIRGHPCLAGIPPQGQLPAVDRSLLRRGGILTGSFIVVMHTAAMAAIVVSTDVTYPWQAHVVSFGFAVLVSAFALLLAFRGRSRTGFTIRRLFTAFLLGCGIHLLWLAVTFERLMRHARCSMLSKVAPDKFSR